MDEKVKATDLEEDNAASGKAAPSPTSCDRTSRKDSTGPSLGNPYQVVSYFSKTTMKFERLCWYRIKLYEREMTLITDSGMPENQVIFLKAEEIV